MSQTHFQVTRAAVHENMTVSAQCHRALGTKKQDAQDSRFLVLGSRSPAALTFSYRFNAIGRAEQEPRIKSPGVLVFGSPGPGAFKCSEAH